MPKKKSTADDHRQFSKEERDALMAVVRPLENTMALIEENQKANLTPKNSNKLLRLAQQQIFDYQQKLLESNAQKIARHYFLRGIRTLADIHHRKLAIAPNISVEFCESIMSNAPAIAVHMTWADPKTPMPDKLTYSLYNLYHTLDFRPASPERSKNKTCV